MSKSNDGWFKVPGFFGTIIVIVIVYSWFGDSDKNTKDDTANQSSVVKSSTSKTQKGKWWESTDKYAICYANVTKAHKRSGLHERNRAKSIQIKEELCKIAATSKTGEGAHWLE